MNLLELVSGESAALIQTYVSQKNLLFKKNWH